MKQTDIERIIRAKGYERGVRDCLVLLLEEINDLRGIVNETVDAISSMASVITTLNVVADGMKNKIDRLTYKGDDVHSVTPEED
jgi:hypothetical protein